MSAGAPFDIRGPLPTGVTVLEASAGTGKTYTIAALAVRHVAEGTPLERLLLVTFTRMATGELRERVRERLVGVERGLQRALDGAPGPDPDEVVRLLAAGPADEVGRRRARLARAISGFDAATIETTHGFCQEVLRGLGFAGDLERDFSFAEDVSDLVAEVVDDLYVRRFHRGDTPAFTRSHAGQIVQAATGNPATTIAAADGDVSEMRRRLALAARRELDVRKRGAALMTFDDLLTRLDDALKGPQGAAAARRLRARFGVVLVDEFQDTDPVQWSIVRRAFGTGDTTLVLIGDPKQAIYAFRGADVFAYLDAAHTAGTRATLDVNHRSDQGLLDAYDALFGGVKLGHEDIVYRRVRAAPAHREPRLSGAPQCAPLRVRVVRRDTPGIALTAGGYAEKHSTQAHIVADLAADVVALLSGGAELEGRLEDGTATGRERVRPGDVAVLVPTNNHAALVRDALEEAGVPAVLNGAGSVFATADAHEWLRLLEALERPTSPPRARSAALTCFLGWSPERVAAADDDAWAQLHARLHDWARILRLRGVASLTEKVMLAERLPRRILAVTDGERRLTDLRHVAQLLHAEASAERLGTTALTAWLRRRIAEAEAEAGNEDRRRRLESDDEAVQIVTVHSSKGLEFPVVYLPFLIEPGHIRPNQPVSFHDAGAGDERVLDVGLQGAAYRRHREQHIAERRGEELRLAYVALTRARHQAVVWWAGSWNSRDSPLGRLLFARDGEGNVAASGDAVPDDAAAEERFATLAAQAPGCVSVERSVLGLPATWGGPLPEHARLEAAAFDRGLDRRWRRTSYSDITAGAYEARVLSEPEEAVVADEPQRADDAGAPVPAPDGDGEPSPPSAWDDVPAGVHVGTLVHRVLEATDFAAADLDAELRAQVAAAQARRPVVLGDADLLITGLREAIETPLGPLVDGARLRDVRRSDRLDELDFELPLAGGDEPAGHVTLSALGDVLREHLPAGDPLAGYAGRLGDPALRQSVRGYLTGSLDLVVRVPGPDGVARFAVLDHKTNRLAPHGETLTVAHHRPEALAAEMGHSHYGLQALLYTVALHRYLRWRVPGYDAGRNLAGVLYLFLRGMGGPGTPTAGGTPYGVFAWRPEGALVEALSDVLDGAGAR